METQRSWLAACAALASVVGGAAHAQLVRDFSPGPSTSLHRLDGLHALVNDHLVVGINDPELGAELWTASFADGRPHLLADFDSRIPSGGRQTLAVAVVWPGPEFALLNVNNGRALWVTDGTVDGTRELRGDLQPFQVLGRIPGSNRVALTGFQPGGFGIWATDGTRQGTILLRELQVSSGIVPPVVALAWEGRLVFRGIHVLQPESLWQTDGTPEGTGPLVDLPGAPDPTVSNPVVTDDGLYFFASGQGFGTKVWHLANPASTPSPVATVPTAADRLLLWSDLWPVGRQLFFVAGPQYRGASLWRWDPRAATPLAEVSPSFGPETEIWLEGSAHDGHRLAFWVFDFATRDSAVWLSDGTGTGLRRIHAVTAPSVSFRVSEVRHGSGGFVFGTHDPPANLEIRRFDDASETPQVILALPGLTGPRSFHFRDRIGFFIVEPNAFSYWSTDGSATRPDLLFRSDFSEGRSARCLLLDRDRLGCYSLSSDHTAELWLSEGTPSTTFHRSPGVVLDPLGQSTFFSYVGAAPGAAYAQADGLWRAVGPGTAISRVLDSEIRSAGVVATSGVEGLDYAFAASSVSPACGLWALPRPTGEPRCLVDSAIRYAETVIHQGQLYYASDGGLFRTRGFAPPLLLTGEDSQAVALATTNAGVWFFGRDRLGFTDGTVEGTRIVRNLSGGGQAIATLGDRLFFVVRSTDPEPATLWTSDGTEAGTRVLVPLPAGRVPGRLRATGSRLFLVMIETDSRWDELWTIDPREPAPAWRLLKRVAQSGSLFVEPEADFEIAGSRVVFSASDPILGPELWVSDGTEEGTYPLVDLWPGRLGSQPLDLTRLANGLVAFSAAEPRHGREPWITDGTLEGTRRLADLARGRRSSLPKDFALVNRTVYFTATDAIHGREWFAVPLAGLPDDGTIEPPLGPWLSSPAVPGFRFKVRIGDAPGVPGVKESACLRDTLCVSGAVRGRAEVFLRIVGPRPNGRLWPTLVKFTTSAVEVWIEQEATGTLRHYRLEGSRPGEDDLPGLFDREGFVP